MTHLPPKQTRNSSQKSVGAQASPFFFIATHVGEADPAVWHRSPTSHLTDKVPHASPALATFLVLHVWLPAVSQ